MLRPVPRLTGDHLLIYLEGEEGRKGGGGRPGWLALRWADQTPHRTTHTTSHIKWSRRQSRLKNICCILKEPRDPYPLPLPRHCPSVPPPLPLPFANPRPPPALRLSALFSPFCLPEFGWNMRNLFCKFYVDVVEQQLLFFVSFFSPFTFFALFQFFTFGSFSGSNYKCTGEKIED